jgi:chromosome partitioning protein
MKVGKGAPTAHDIFRTQDAQLADAVRPTVFDNIALAPADTMFEHGNGLRDELLLGRALAQESIDSAFDVVLLDTPPTLDIVLLNALIAANWVLVPYVPHPLSLEGVRQLMRVLFKVISGQNQALKLAGFLPMMATENIRQHRAIKSDVAHQFGALRLLPGIRMDIRLAEAFAAGQPIRYYAPKSRGAEDFSNLASLFSEKCFQL